MKFKILLFLLWLTFLFQGQNFSYPEWANRTNLDDYTWSDSGDISWRDLDKITWNGKDL